MFGKSSKDKAAVKDTDVTALQALDGKTGEAKDDEKDQSLDLENKPLAVNQPEQAPVPSAQPEPETKPTASTLENRMNSIIGEQFSIKARGHAELKNEGFNEVSAPSLQAYGISVSSKNGRYTQILEMLAYARDAQIAGVNQFIKSLSYSEDTCAIEFTSSDMEGTSIALIAKYIARERLTKFSVLGSVETGLSTPCDGK